MGKICTYKRVNSEKFECMRFYEDPEKVPSSQYLAPDNSPFTVKSYLRDRGTRVSNFLSFTSHIENTIQAGSRLVGWGCKIIFGQS